MQLNKLNKKSYAVLKALAQGRSCEEILTHNRTLSPHDVFHALSEMPTSHWRKHPVPRSRSGQKTD